MKQSHSMDIIDICIKKYFYKIYGSKVDVKKDISNVIVLDYDGTFSESFCKRIKNSCKI